MDTLLTFVNRSLAGKTSEVVIFQRNLAMDMGALSVAWKVIRYCGRDCTHPLIYPADYELAVGDQWGNFSPRLRARNGQAFNVVGTPLSGRRLQPDSRPCSPTEIQVLNELQRGAVNVCLYRGGALLGVKTSVAPQQKAVFQYKPTIWIGVASQVVQGSPFDSAVVPSRAIELSLLGIASADIVMTGGGPGPDAEPYDFTLENIVPM